MSPEWTVFAGQTVGVKQTDDHIWLVTYMDYDLGYFDDETCRLEPIDNAFGAKVLPMSPERTDGAKWRLAKARPEPDFRYFSNLTASCSARNSSDTTTDQGLSCLVCPLGPWLCQSRRLPRSFVIPT